MDDPEAASVAALALLQGRECYLVFGAEEISRIARDDANFSSCVYREVMTWGETILSMDEPEHARYRALVQPAFSRNGLAQWDAEIIRPIMDSLIDDFATDGHADLIAQFTAKFPFLVICRLLGFPPRDDEQVKAWTLAVVNAWMDPEASLKANDAIREYFRPVVEARRRDPKNDLVSRLINADLDGRKLTDAELDSFMLFLFPAGADTTYYSSSNVLCALLTHPGQLDAVRLDRSLVPKAVEEGLRWETGAPQFNLRRARHDVEVAGVPIPAGADVVLMFGSQNRDPAWYRDPDAFDLFRSETPRSTFGTGPHTCMGNYLARLEIRTAVNALLDRLPNVRLDPDAPAPEIRGIPWRGPPTLPVVFDR
jgi:cytochrome P450